MRSKVQFHNIDTSDPRFGLHGGGAWDLQASLINIAKTEFMLNSYLKAARESMNLMVVDTFDTLDGIDSSKSSGYGLMNGRIIPCLSCDDFSNQVIDTSKWQVSSGTWAVEDGELSGTTNGRFQAIVLKSGPYSDFSVSVKVKWISGSYFEHGVLLRAQQTNPSQNCYMVYLSKYDNTARIARHVNGTAVVLATSSFTPQTGATYEFKVDIVGEQIKFYINGTLCVQATDSTYQSGTLGLGVNASTAEHVHYDDFVIKDSAGLTIITSVPEILPIAPNRIFFTADDSPSSGTISYYASRDGGTTWTPVQKDSITDLSSQPLGQSLVVKAELTGDAYISAWAYGIA